MDLTSTTFLDQPVSDLLLLHALNSLLSPALLPTLHHILDATPYLLILLYEVTRGRRIPYVDREGDEGFGARLKNLKLLVGCIACDTVLRLGRGTRRRLVECDLAGFCEKDSEAVRGVLGVFVEVVGRAGKGVGDEKGSVGGEVESTDGVVESTDGVVESTDEEEREDETGESTESLERSIGTILSRRAPVVASQPEDAELKPRARYWEDVELTPQARNRVGRGISHQPFSGTGAEIPQAPTFPRISRFIAPRKRLEGHGTTPRNSPRTATMLPQSGSGAVLRPLGTAEDTYYESDLDPGRNDESPPPSRYLNLSKADYFSKRSATPSRALKPKNSAFEMDDHEEEDEDDRTSLISVSPASWSEDSFYTAALRTKRAEALQRLGRVKERGEIKARESSLLGGAEDAKGAGVSIIEYEDIQEYLDRVDKEDGTVQVERLEELLKRHLRLKGYTVE